LGYIFSPKWYKFNNKILNKYGNLCARAKEEGLIKSHSTKFFIGGTKLNTFILSRRRFHAYKIGGQVLFNSTLTPLNNNNSNKLTYFLIEQNLKPVYCYEDLHLDSTRKKIKNGDLKS
jgi:hypothetical protein